MRVPPLKSGMTAMRARPAARPRFSTATTMRAGTVKLSRIYPFCGRILLDQRLIINDLAVAAGGEDAAKLLNLTVPAQVLIEGFSTDAKLAGQG